MERRGFLSFLGVAGAGLFMPSLPETVVYDPKVKALAAGTLVGLEQITEAMGERFGAVLGGRPMAVPGSRLGEAGLHQQFYVDLEFPAEMEVSRERVILPYADSLAERARALDLARFGTLPLPNGGALGHTYHGKGFSLRGVQQWDAFSDLVLMRFDVIGGQA